MTSNVGAREIAQSTPLGFQSDPNTGLSDKEIHSRVMSEMKKLFRPEFLNRIDEIIVFHPLTATDLSSIVNLMLAKVGEKLAHFEVKLDASEEAKKLLIDHGTDVEYGARPLRRTIQKEVEDPISELILQEGLEKKKVLHMDAKDSKLTFHAE